MAKLALQTFTPAALLARFPEIRPLEARRIVACVHRDEWVYAPMRDVRKSTAEMLAETTHVPELQVHTQLKSALDPFVKLALTGSDGRVFEAVRIPLEKAGRFTACVSSQVGCALACAFCATGRLGLQRNLEAWEIVEQVRVLRRTLQPGERMHGVVFQGMGEPMANLDRVLEAIAILTDPCTPAIDQRNVTVCTSGLPQGIQRLAQQAPKVRLGLSIGSARSSVRKDIMPIEKAHPLSTVLDAVAEHVAITGLAPMFAVALLQGVNDSPEDAHALLDMTRAFALRTGVRPRLSIIPYNTLGDDDPFARSTNEDAFRQVLHSAGQPTHKRYSGGQDVGAACGQLAGPAAGSSA